jgi:hypothetical protein
MTRSTILFSIPSFWRGLAASIDIGNTLTIYNDSETAEEADYKAIYSDWSAVGGDIRYAMQRWANGE